MIAQLVFNISSFDIFIAIVLLIFFSYCAYRNISNSNKTLGFYVTEALRLIIVSLLVIMLFEPEWSFENKDKKIEKIVVLVDKSNSMNTDDVDGKKLSRNQHVNKVIDFDKKFKEYQEKLKDRYSLEFKYFSGESSLSDYGMALNNILENNKDSLKSVLLVGDGSWNDGEDPKYIAEDYAFNNKEIHTFIVGEDHYLEDLVLHKTDLPSFCLLKERLSLPYRITNHFKGEVKTTIYLKDENGQILHEKDITLKPSSILKGALNWKPKTKGIKKLRLEIPIKPKEVDLENNHLNASIEVKEEEIKVLVVESVPRWEYRFLTNALTRDPGVKVDKLLFQEEGMAVGSGENYIDRFPNTKEEISKYDVIFIGDVKIGDGKKDLTIKQAELIEGLVKNHRSGVIFIPGVREHQLSYKGTPLQKLLPVVYYDKNDNSPFGDDFDKERKMLLTKEGEEHFLTNLANEDDSNDYLWRNIFPGYFWHARVKRTVLGSTTLVKSKGFFGDKGALNDLIVTRSYGSGNVLYVGFSDVWRWRKGFEDLYHYRFWSQVIRWLSHKRYQKNSQNVRLSYTPEQPKMGDLVNFHVNLFDESKNPLTSKDVELIITSPDGIREHVKLRETKGGWGDYKGSYKFKSTGKYNLELNEKGDTIPPYKFSIDIETPQLELVGNPSNSNSLKNISLVTNGKYNKLDDSFYKLIDDKFVNEIQKKDFRRLKIWSEWYFGLLIVLFLAAYWISRKLIGRV